MAEVKVWTVWIRDPWTGTDMECVVATTTRAELHAVLVRCDLRRRGAEIFRRKADDDGSARAVAEGGTLLWRDPEVSSAWQDERALADDRGKYARERPQGWRGGWKP